MSTTESSTIIIPTSPADLKLLKDSIIEASNTRTMIEAKKDHIKDIGANIKAKVGIPPAFFNKMVGVYHKQNFDQVAQKQEDFETLYETVMKSGAIKAIDEE